MKTNYQMTAEEVRRQINGHEEPLSMDEVREH